MAFWQACWDFAKEEIVELFKEFYGQKSFAKSLNATFLVIIPKKGGAEDLREFRPISLLGGLYKLMAKVLANRLKMVLDKVVSTDQNAFVRGRQILDASLIVNEVVDYWQKRKEKGLVCKLDIEKAYDSISWSFLMKVLKKMGFFSSSKGLRQGDPISPYLFILGMEVLSALIRRAVRGNFISSCRLRGRGDVEIMVSHLLFADDTILFCEASKDQLTHLGWTLAWFEAASGLRINLAKSELIPIGEIDNIEEMAVELGCRIGSFSVKYLGLPLGARHKALSTWDGVEERIRRRLARWKRQYLSKGGRITLIKSTLASIPMYQMSIFRMPKRMGLLNKALLGKWIWRFSVEKDVLWKKVIGVKHGLEGCGWKSKEARGPFGVGVWKEILKEMSWCWNNMKFKIFALAVCSNELVNDVWDPRLGQGGWNLRLVRDSNDWELVLIEDLLFLLRDIRGNPRRGLSALERTLWEIAFALFGVQWLFPEKVKEALFCWRGPFVAISGLNINLEKSEILPVGSVENAEVLASELGCKVGSLPSTYLGLPLGAPHKSVVVWDGVEERMRKRLALWKRQFISKGGRLTLIRSTLASMPDLSYVLDAYSKSWPYCVNGAGALRLKEILFGNLLSARSMGKKKEGGSLVRLGKAMGWGCGRKLERKAFFSQDAWVEDCWDYMGDAGEWNPCFSRSFNDWELEAVASLLSVLQGKRLNVGMEDRVVWNASKNGSFSVKSLYNTLDSGGAVPFPWRIIWSPCVPTKVGFLLGKLLGGRS
ncbi:LINE-1 retrotransposable element ORF2 protein [Vitis vinifera]|uniref:LINE-1 retrotransposable element ORF2 protein n=1 Tax=Vitis vinifera TaxID=29760 RepID=A0A438G233_VITVI|nr:LINE-1 retrotransposable element ORF2 protein [Vitis vinifera]